MEKESWTIRYSRAGGAFGKKKMPVDKKNVEKS